MKRLLIALGLVGIVGVAMADTSVVTFSVDDYRAMQLLTAATSPTITDGGFGGNYYAPFTVEGRGNVTWTFTASYILDAPSLAKLMPTAGHWTLDVVKAADNTLFTGVGGGPGPWESKAGRCRLYSDHPGTDFITGGLAGTLTVTIGA